jgi:predicted GNAT family acetyltransferase
VHQIRVQLPHRAARGRGLQEAGRAAVAQRHLGPGRIVPLHYCSSTLYQNC